MKRISIIISLIFTVHFSFCQCTINMANWELIFGDEFNYTATSELWKKWLPDYTNTFHSNDNIHLDGENLILTIKEVPVYNADYGKPVPCNVTGVRLVAKDTATGNPLYFHFGNTFVLPYVNHPNVYDNDIEGGYFEMRCKMPHYSIKDELIAAFWLFGTDEFDIFENVRNENFFCTVHSLDSKPPYGFIPPPENGYSYGCTNDYVNTKNRSLHDEFHTYSLMWEVDKKNPMNQSKIKITFFLDGRELKTVDYMPCLTVNVGNYFPNSNSPFEVLIVSMAPILAGFDGIKHAFLSKDDGLIIDYVRTYRKKNNVLPTKKPLDFEINSSVGYKHSVSSNAMACGTGNRLFFRDSNKYIMPVVWGNGTDDINNYYKQPISNAGNAIVEGDIEVFRNEPYFVRIDGRIAFLHWNENSNSYIHLDLLGLDNMPVTQNVSTEHASFKKGTTHEVLYYRNTANELMRIQWNGYWTSALVASGVGGAIAMDQQEPANSDIAIFKGTDNKLHIYTHAGATNNFVDPAGINAPADFDVKGDIHYAWNQIIYHGADDKIQCYTWTGNQWVHSWISTANSMNAGGRMKVLTKTIPSLINTANNPNGVNYSGDNFIETYYTNVVYYAGIDSQIHCLYWENDVWNDAFIKENCNSCTVENDFVVTANNQLIYAGIDAIKTDFMSYFGCEIKNQQCSFNNIDKYFNGQFEYPDNPYSSSKTDYTAYPNPFDNYINIIGIKDYTIINLIDMQGRKIITADIKDDDLSTINTSNVRSGLYILQLISNKKIINKKVQKL